MAHKLKDQYRRDVDFRNRSVKEVLPEFYQDDYPDLVKFLEYYYDWMDSNTGSSFVHELKRLNAARDIGETEEASLEQLIEELTGDPIKANQFKDARFAVRRLADHFRNKGTRFSAEEFFRLFFEEDAEIKYGKEDVFKIGESTSGIGVESQKFIQNYGRYQLFSILIKSGLSTSKYESLYKKFVHPSGWYFEGEVSAIGEADLSLNPLTVSIPDSVPVKLVGEAQMFSPMLFPLSAHGELTGIESDAVAFTGADGGAYRKSFLTNKVNAYQTTPLEQLTRSYRTIADLLTPNSFTFDEDILLGSQNADYTIHTADSTDGFRYLNVSTAHPTYVAGNDSSTTRILRLGDSSENASIGTQIRFTDSGLKPYDLRQLDSSNTYGLTTFGADGSGNFNAITVRWKGVNQKSFSGDTRINGIWNEEDSTNSTSAYISAGGGPNSRWQKVVHPGMLLYYPGTSPNAVFRLDSAIGTTSGNRNWYSVSRLRIDSDAAPDMSLAFETMDNEMYSRYTSDSAI